MAHFLEALPFDFSDPGAQALLELLSLNLARQKDILQIVSLAGIRAGLVNWEQPTDAVWYDVLRVARNQDRLVPLMDSVRKYPASGPAVVTRLDELLRPVPVLEAAPRGGGGGGGGFWQGGNEAFTGKRDTMLDVSFLQRGVERARAVVRLLVRYPGATSCGTGFLIGPDLVLTNHHVLYLHLGPGEGIVPDSVEVWFNYERGPDGADRPVTPVAASRDTIQGDRAADWAVIRLSSPAPADAVPLALRPSLPLGVGDRVYIIQHPGGGPKKLGLDHPEVRYVDDGVAQYLTDTLEGSSGSPVFNDRWEVVALHQRSVRVVAPDGQGQVHNQGIRIERVVAGLAGKGAG